MYIDERLLKILDTHKGETIDVNFMISLIKTIAKEHETEQLLIGSVSKTVNCDHCKDLGRKYAGVALGHTKCPKCGKH